MLPFRILSPGYFDVTAFFYSFSVSHANEKEMHANPVAEKCIGFARLFEKHSPNPYLSTIEKNIMNFVSTGGNLYIHSSITGNGKTSWALRLVQAYFSNIWLESSIEDSRALFINVPTYTRELKLSIGRYSEYIQMVNDSVLTADIVVWDDIAIKSNSSYEYEQLLSILDTRINDKKCNIFTSNVLPNDLSKCLGSRLSSRILGTSSVIELKGVDKRGWK